MRSVEADATLRALVEDHSAEGAELLFSEPPRLWLVALLGLGAIVLATVIWASLASTNVVTTVQGRIAPDGEERRVYSAVSGKLTALYVLEGDEVTAGDVLARVRSREAVSYEQQRLQTELNLEAALVLKSEFPSQKRVMELELENLQRRIETLEGRLHREISVGSAQDRQQQQARLERAISARDEARIGFEQAETAWLRVQQFVGDSVTPAEAGGLRAQFERARASLVARQADIAELESQLINESARRKDEFAQLQLELATQRVALQQRKRDMVAAEREVDVNLRKAQIEAEAADLVTIVNVDGEFSALVRAPTSGVITYIEQTQVGDAVAVDTPLLLMVPEDSKPILRVSVPEQSTVLIVPGQTQAKVKFQAFPYQRYGLIEGVVSSIAPTSRANDNGRGLYEAKIDLQRDHFLIDGTQKPLRYGMTATADIVTERRRMISYILDPLRGM